MLVSMLRDYWDDQNSRKWGSSRQLYSEERRDQLVNIKRKSRRQRHVHRGCARGYCKYNINEDPHFKGQPDRPDLSKLCMSGSFY